MRMNGIFGPEFKPTCNGVNTVWFPGCIKINTRSNDIFVHTFWHSEYCFGYIFYILSIIRVCMFIFLVFLGYLFRILEAQPRHNYLKWPPPTHPPRALEIGMHFQTLLSLLLKVPRMELPSSLLWWELGINLPGHGALEYFLRIINWSPVDKSEHQVNNKNSKDIISRDTMHWTSDGFAYLYQWIYSCRIVVLYYKTRTRHTKAFDDYISVHSLKSWLWLAAVACVVRWPISNALLNDIWLTRFTRMCNQNYWHKRWQTSQGIASGVVGC